jgi:hypothetical protein
MRNTSIRRILGVATSAGMLLATPAITHAAQPSVMQDEGAYVRIVGSPADGTVKFQFGWSASTPASAAVGYWVGVYDVTHSHYVWVIETDEMELPGQYFRNAKPTVELPNGEYKVNLFVRGSYSPVSNLAEIEFPFEVTNSTS